MSLWVTDCRTPSSLSFTVSWNLLRSMSIESVMLSNKLILCRPLLFFSSIFPSIRVFFSESAPHIRRPKDWSFSFSVSPSNEYSGLISFNIGWLDLLLSKGLSRIFYNTYSKASVLGCGSAFFTVQLLHLYITSGKNKGLPMQTFVSKVMSLFFNMLSRLVIAFLPRSKCLLISWLQSLSAVILEPKKIKCHCFHFFPIYLPWIDGTTCHDLSFINVEF